MKNASAHVDFVRKTLVSSFVAVAAAAAMFLAPVPGSGQDAPKGAPPAAPGAAKGAKATNGAEKYGPYYQAPKGTDNPPFTRTTDGKPDMQGFWTPRIGQSIFDVQGKQGAIVDPPDGMLPYKPEAAAKAKNNKANNMYMETEAHCWQSGVPHSAYQQFGYQIVQTPAAVVLMPEYTHSYRVIPTDNRKHIPGEVKLFMGDSVGHWEGDTFVVETTNQNGKVWLDMQGNFTTEAIHVMERFTMVDANTINYEAVITDPSIYTKPWKTAGQLGRHPDTNYEIMEFACHEGNEDLAHYIESEGGKAAAKGARTN